MLGAVWMAAIFVQDAQVSFGGLGVLVTGSVWHDPFLCYSMVSI